MRILVTGSTGHIANVLIRELLKKGYNDITAFIRNGEKSAWLDGLMLEI